MKHLNRRRFIHAVGVAFGSLSLLRATGHKTAAAEMQDDGPFVLTGATAMRNKFEPSALGRTVVMLHIMNHTEGSLFAEFALAANGDPVINRIPSGKLFVETVPIGGPVTLSVEASEVELLTFTSGDHEELGRRVIVRPDSKSPRGYHVKEEFKK